MGVANSSKSFVRHPSVLQFRWERVKEVDKDKKEKRASNIKELIVNYLKKKSFEYCVENRKNGFDVYFSDVNEARKLISFLGKQFKFDLKMSTKYAGLRKGRVRVLFVYSIKMK